MCVCEYVYNLYVSIRLTFRTAHGYVNVCMRVWLCTAVCDCNGKCMFACICACVRVC